MKTEEVNTLKARGYRPEDYYNNNPVIKSCIDRMYAGINGCKFTEVADSLRTLDPYMVLADFDSYCQVQEHSSKLYTDMDQDVPAQHCQRRHLLRRPCCKRVRKGYLEYLRTGESFPELI